MKRYLKSTYVALFAMFAFIFLMADSCTPTSDDIQQQQQEKRYQVSVGEEISDAEFEEIKNGSNADIVQG